MTGHDGSGAAASTDVETATPARPLLRITSGNPTPTEVAVITAVLAARASTSSGERPAVAERSLWGRPAHVRRARPRSWMESRLPH